MLNYYIKLIQLALDLKYMLVTLTKQHYLQAHCFFFLFYQRIKYTELFELLITELKITRVYWSS